MLVYCNRSNKVCSNIKMINSILDDCKNVNIL